MSQLPQKAHRHTPPSCLNSKCRPFTAIHTTFRLSQHSLLMALCGFIEGLIISCQSVKNKVCSWNGPPKSLFSTGPYGHARPIVKDFFFFKSSRSKMIQLIVIKLAFELQRCWQRLPSATKKKKKSIAESAASPLSAMTEDR